MKRPVRAIGRRINLNERGFTLVEVLVSAALFVGVFVTLSTLFAQATTGFSGTRIIAAATLAQSAMEEAIAAGNPKSREWTERSNRILWNIVQGVEPASDGFLTVRVIVTRVSDGKVYASLWTQLSQPTTQ